MTYSCRMLGLLFAVCTCLSYVHGQAQQELYDSPPRYEIILPPIPPNIYAQAPSRVRVTTVRVKGIEIETFLSQIVTPFDELDESRDDDRRVASGPASSCFPRFSLEEETDDANFLIDACSGIITTARYVEKSLGESYDVVVAAGDGSGLVMAAREITITVTQYNTKPPVFSHSHYSHEVLDVSDLNTLVMTVTATDEDMGDNAFYYALQPSSEISGLVSAGNPWLYPVTTPVAVNPTSGEIFVSGSLLSVKAALRYRVFVSDGGSPQRQDSAKLTLYVRNMSAPRNVHVVNVTEHSLELCWSPPLHGHPEGYLVLYSSRRLIPSTNRLHRGKMNLTLDQLQMIEDLAMTPIPFTVEGDPSSTPHQGPVEVTRPLCSLVDDLHPSTSYSVSVRAWASLGRMSMARNPLAVVTHKRACNESICFHGACQEKEAPPGFRCHCPPGYYGERCHLTDFCLLSTTSPCLNGGTCLGREDGTPECVCLSGFSGTRCEVVNSCVAYGNICLNGGTCLSEDSGVGYKCLCPPNFTGDVCGVGIKATTTSPWSCPAAQSISSQGVFDWPPTSLGNTAFLPCPYQLLPHLLDGPVVEVRLPPNASSDSNNYDYVRVDTSESPNRSQRSVRVEAEVDTEELHRRITRSYPSIYHASRTCSIPPGSTTLSWLTPNTSSCQTAEGAADQIVNITASSRQSNATVMASSISTLAHLVNQAVADTGVAAKMISAISHILNANATLIDQTNQESPNATDTILATINEYTAKVVLQPGETVVHRAENLVVEAQLLPKDSLPDKVTFTPLDLDDENHSDLSNKDPGKVWIKIPKLALKNATLDNIRLQFISFKNDRIFRSSKHARLLNHRVLCANIDGIQTDHLPAPVSYMIPVRKLDPMLMIPRCVFWDTSEREWSTEGVRTLQTEKGQVFCEADHLTSFSVLLDPIGSPIAAHIKPALSILTYVGIALSTVALVATIVTFALFRSMNRDRSGLIVMNLSMALLLLNLGFLAALFITSQHELCVTFGALVHYAVAASFSWMLIEAVNMYQLLVTVFPSSETHFMRKRVLLGWGVPLLFVMVALVWERHIYFTEYQGACIISSTVSPLVYYITYLAPICVVLFINFVVFLRVLRVLCQGRPSYKRSVSVTLAQIRGAVAIVTLLGITWLLGVFAVRQFRMVSQFLFCLTTPFQGLIIFWVRVMQSGEARMAWKSFLSTGSTRLRPRQFSSVRTNSSLHHSSSLHTRSTNLSSSTQKSSFVSALKAARRGLRVSSKSKHDRTASTKDSIKKLSKTESCESQNQITSTSRSEPPAKSLPTNGNEYRRLSNRLSQDSLGTSLSNSKSPAGPSSIKDKDLSDQDPPSCPGERSPNAEDSTPVNLPRILQNQFFAESSVDLDINMSPINESTLTNSHISARAAKPIVRPNSLKMYLENERNILCRSNLNRKHTSEPIPPEVGKRSLESLRRVIFNLKVGSSSRFRQCGLDIARSVNAHEGKGDSVKNSNSLFNPRPLNGDTGVIKASSYPKINEPSPENQHYPIEQYTNEESLERQPLTDVIPLDNFNGISSNQRATSEQHIGPTLNLHESQFRRCVSTAELENTENFETPQENLLQR